MRDRIVRVSLFTLLVAACADDASTQSPGAVADGARIHRDAVTNRLTAPRAGAATAIVRDYLAPHVGAAADQLVLEARTTGADGIAHVRFAQTVGGVRVHGAYVKAAITARGELVQVIEKLAPATGLARATTVTPEAALAAAMAELGYAGARPAQTGAQGQTLRFARVAELYREPTVERVAYVDGSGALRQGYLVETWSLRENQLDHTLVGGDGAIVAIEHRTANDSYNVFVEDPLKGGQTVQQGPGGWLGTGTQTTIDIRGPNAHAYLDRDNNNAPDAGGTAVTDGNFLAVADLAVAPTTPTNQAVAVQNLFFLNNVTHDLLETHGFTPETGNFEGDDPVNAEAQDGGGTDNANFATPTDGSSPRMQMYLWSGAGPSAELTVGDAKFAAYQSGFGPALTATGKAGALAVADDGTGTTSDACEAMPRGSLTGKIAIVDRGACNFTVKVWNAQVAGAVAVVIANNVDTKPFAPGGTDRKVRIPSAMVSQADGTTLKGRIAEPANLHAHPVTPLQVDGDLDSDVVYHEYGHGLTWRMIGSMDGPMSGAIGEGASDTLAFLVNGDDRIGEYAFSDPRGIRRYPYQGYPLTYGDVDGGEVHNDGEIYAAAMWRVYQNYLAAELTATDVLHDWVQGMLYTPAGPAMEDMRDGMLQAAPADRDCLIWRGFAETGIGVGADGVVSRGGRAVTITESFALPAECP